MPRGHLIDRLERIGDELSTEEAETARAYVAELRSAGVESFEDLARLVTDGTSEQSLRVTGCRLFGWLGDAHATSPLENVLSNVDDAGLLWEAAKALARLHASQATSTLVDVLVHGTSAQQSAAAWVLGWVGGVAAVPSLRKAALDMGLPPDVRSHAAEALGVMRAQDAIDDLVTLLSDENAEIRYWAAYALGEIGDIRAVAALQRVAAIELSVLPSGRSVRQEALNALSAIQENVDKQQ